MRFINILNILREFVLNKVYEPKYFHSFCSRVIDCSKGNIVNLGVCIEAYLIFLADEEDGSTENVRSEIDEKKYGSGPSYRILIDKIVHPMKMIVNDDDFEMMKSTPQIMNVIVNCSNKFSAW